MFGNNLHGSTEDHTFSDHAIIIILHYVMSMFDGPRNLSVWKQLDSTEDKHSG